MSSNDDIEESVKKLYASEYKELLKKPDFAKSADEALKFFEEFDFEEKISSIIFKYIKAALKSAVQDSKFMEHVVSVFFSYDVTTAEHEIFKATKTFYKTLPVYYFQVIREEAAKEVAESFEDFKSSEAPNEANQ